MRRWRPVLRGQGRLPGPTCLTEPGLREGTRRPSGCSHKSASSPSLLPPALTPSSLAPSQICLQRRSAPCRALASQRPRTARPQPHAPRLQPQSHAPRPPSCNPMHEPHGLHGWRVGLLPGCAGLQAGRVGLQAGGVRVAGRADRATGSRCGLDACAEHDRGARERHEARLAGRALTVLVARAHHTDGVQRDGQPCRVPELRPRACRWLLRGSRHPARLVALAALALQACSSVPVLLQLTKLLLRRRKLLPRLFQLRLHDASR